MRKNFGCKVVNLILWIMFTLAVAAGGYFVRNGVATSSVAKLHLFETELSLSLRIDALSTIMLAMVTMLAAVVGQYSLRYLDGESRQWYFYRFLLTTVLAVSLLVLSSNLIMFFAAWLGISWGLHHLLLYSSDRKAAVYAARKKLLVSRLGDLAVLAGIALVYRACGSFDFQEIFAFAERSSEQLSAAARLDLSLAGFALAFGAMTKSAQFPFHFWLPETMETPTPVSALMHAGVINAGGYLVIRLSPIMAHAHWASTLLAVAGAFTAVYGALVMMTQNNIKKKLAYSTMAQMGMMMFACGIGAYSFALFHILAHSFYKAYAFLSTASVIEENKQISLPSAPLSAGSRVLVLLSAGMALAVGMWWQEGRYLAGFLYASVLSLGLAQSLSSLRHGTAFLRITVTGTVLLAVLVFISLETGLKALTAEELTSFLVPLDHVKVVASALSLAIFAVGFWLANELMAPTSERSRRLYVALWNDSYLGTRSSAWLNRVWPA